MKFSCLSKTFVIGEYAVLQAGSAIIALSEPAFTLTLEQGESNCPFPKDSPAYRFYERNAATFNHYHLTFTDPYEGRGGFGASSAQFLLLYRAYITLQDPNAELDYASLHQAYLDAAWDGQGTPPSGADVIAQTLNAPFALVTQNPWQAIPLTWPFKDMTYHIEHTTNKVKTHEHLRTKPNVAANQLHTIIERATGAWQSSDSQAFADAINAYAECLKQQGLQTEASQTLCQQILAKPSVCAVKGCGALGADVLFIVKNN